MSPVVCFSPGCTLAFNGQSFLFTQLLKVDDVIKVWHKTNGIATAVQTT